MNRDSIESQISETAEEAKRLPPELRAMNAAMDAVFGALNAAPQENGERVPGATSPSLAAHAPAGAAPDFAPRRMDIEDAIMRCPGFDYNLCWEIFAALRARLESRYEDRLNEKVAEAMKALDRALAEA